MFNIYLQLSFIFGGCFLHPQPEDALRRLQLLEMNEAKQVQSYTVYEELRNLREAEQIGNHTVSRRFDASERSS